jgi:coniferyl-aldehyde dehydrogenase
MATQSSDTAPAESSADHELHGLLARQKKAFASNINPDHATRLDRLNRLERLLERDAEHLADLIAKDFGTRSRTVTAIGETVVLRSAIRHARRHLKTWMKPRRQRTGMAHRTGRSRLLRQPLGVVGIIGPWNYPLQLLVAPLVGALAAGNRAILKPSEITPLFAEALKHSVQAFFGADEVAVVTGDADVGRLFASLPFDHLMFTGSTAVGRLVAQATAKNLTPVTLELGGKSPAIIDASCDLAQATERLAWGKLLNSGQTCIAPDYALVPRAQVHAFVEAVQASITKQYPSIAANPDYTSIVNARHYQRLRGLVEDARSRGARVIELNPARETLDASTRKLPPTLLLDVKDDMQAMREEIFGPLLPIVAYDTLDDAIAYVNERDRPLALYWFGTDRAHRERVLTNTLSGGVTINDTMMHIAQEDLPFGGVGPSGQGHYHGEFGFRTFSKEKPVFIQGRFSAARLVYPPYTSWTDRVLRLLLRYA